MIGNGDDNPVELLLLDHLSEVRILRGCRVFGRAQIEHLGIHVAQRGDIFAGFEERLCVALSLAGKPDDPNVQFFVGRVAPRQAGRQDHEGGGSF
ncbi:MAG: hypothetical protein NTW28_29435 [Candidatus Solibacter sp.]|nr:hypothetical protein [Candidatus Solibacter sp.]